VITKTLSKDAACSPFRERRNPFDQGDDSGRKQSSAINGRKWGKRAIFLIFNRLFRGQVCAMMMQEGCSPEPTSLVRKVFTIFFHVRKRIASRCAGTWE